MGAVKSINVLVGLDLSAMDVMLIKSIQVVRNLYPVSSFTFLHNIKLSELPEELQTSDKLEKVAAGIKAKLTKLIAAEEVIPEPHQVLVTLERFSEIAFLNVQKSSDSKLIILGNKQKLEGNGGLSQKIIRMSSSAVLLVPETFNAQPKKIIAAIDFSKYSNAISNISRQIIQENKFEELSFEPIHIVKIPWQFFPGLSESETKKWLEKDANEKQKKWSKYYADFPKIKFVLAKEKNIASNILIYGKKVEADILILGAKGTSSIANLFMGSVANELIHRETNLCILLIKTQL